MKIRIECSKEVEKEVIIRCNEIDEEVEQVKELLESHYRKLIGIIDNETYLFLPGEVFYFEYVDTSVFAYMGQKVCSVNYSLEKLEKMLDAQEFFRCSKAMILNLNYIEKFQSFIGNRIIATLSNGEDVVISRHYAKLLRAYLKEGRNDE